MTTQTKTLTTLDIALHYATRWGWAVFPCHSITDDGFCTCGNPSCKSEGKHPVAALVPHGCSDASKDENQIKAWFGALGMPEANIGIATGKVSGLVVVDVDEAKGADISDLGRADVTMTVFDIPKVQTGGGYHFYFAYPQNAQIKNSASRLGKFIDVRGDGGYVIAPPSKHISGKKYEFANDARSLIDFPAEWIAKLTQPAQSALAQNGNGSAANGQQSPFIIPPPVPLFEIPETIPDGARNDTLARLAGSLRRIDLEQSEIEATLHSVNQRKCVPPLTFNEVKEIARKVARYQPTQVIPQVSDPDITNWDDVSIAKMFVSEYKAKIRFNADAKKWLIWSNTHWQTDRTDTVIRKAAEFSQNLYVKVTSLIKNQADMTTAQRQIKRSNTNTGLNAFLNLSKAYLTLTSEDLDKNAYLLNCKNGTIDLKTGVLEPHSASNLITKFVPYDYDAGAQSRTFEKFLADIQPDPVVRAFLQQSIGYSLLGVARERCFWILYGTGNNGKSVFIDLFSELLNDYASSTNSASVMAQKADRIPNDIARLHGKRFIVIPETEENERINAALIKALSGGDKITARFLFGEFFDFYFSGKLWIATNHKPTITDHSKGFWDRLKIIPFTVDIPAANVIKKDTLVAALLDDAPAILKWAVDGVRAYFGQNGLVVPKTIQDEIAAYKYEQDSIAQFIDECCEIGSYHQVDNAKLYRRYKDFCGDNGEYVRSQRRFSQNLKERGFTQTRGASRMWQGIDLKI